MKIRSGNIPEDLIYIVSGKETRQVLWDGVDHEAGDKILKDDVYPTFVSDATNAGTLETGRSWAKNRFRYINGKNVSIAPMPEVARKNEPMVGLRIIDLDVRVNGGRAWKCIDTENRYFDLREDVLLDLIRTEGIDSNGVMRGEYIWARIGAEMKLVRVGSELHKAAIEATELKAMAHIPNKELKVGGIYQLKNGTVYWYLGKPKYYLAQLQGNINPRDDLFARWCGDNDQGGPWRHGFSSYYAGSSGGVGLRNRPMPRVNPLEYKIIPGPPNQLMWQLDEYNPKKDVDVKSLVKEPWIRVEFVSSPKKFVREIGFCSAEDGLKVLRDHYLAKAISAEEEQKQLYPKTNYILLERQRLVMITDFIQYGTAHLTEDLDIQQWVELFMSKEPALG